MMMVTHSKLLSNIAAKQDHALEAQMLMLAKIADWRMFMLLMTPPPTPEVARH